MIYWTFDKNTHWYTQSLNYIFFLWTIFIDRAKLHLRRIGWIFTKRSGTSYPWPLHQTAAQEKQLYGRAWPNLLDQAPHPTVTSNITRGRCFFYITEPVLILKITCLLVCYFWIAARFSSAQVRVSLAQGLGMLEWPSSYSVKPSLKVARPWRKVKLNEACSLCIVK